MHPKVDKAAGTGGWILRSALRKFEGCGYVSAKKDGGERVNFTAFYEGLLEAKGLTFSIGGSAGIGKGGRKLSYKAVVQGNGNLLIGKPYTDIVELSPGDEYEIKLGRNQIRLVPVGGSEEEEWSTPLNEQDPLDVLRGVLLVTDISSACS